jgi:hypothetical protein
MHRFGAFLDHHNQVDRERYAQDGEADETLIETFVHIFPPFSACPITAGVTGTPAVNGGFGGARKRCSHPGDYLMLYGAAACRASCAGGGPSLTTKPK